MTQPRAPDPVSRRVIETVAVKRGVDPTELDPLYDAVDPDCLDRLVSPGSDATTSVERLTFRYAGCRVTVTPGRGVDASPLEERSLNAP